jgi:hypothetical protein
VRFEPANPDELMDGTQRARAARHDGHPWRSHRERHPTLLRNLLLLACFVALAVLAAQHLAGHVH